MKINLFPQQSKILNRIKIFVQPICLKYETSKSLCLSQGSSKIYQSHILKSKQTKYLKKKNLKRQNLNF